MYLKISTVLVSAVSKICSTNCLRRFWMWNGEKQKYNDSNVVFNNEKCDSLVVSPKLLFCSFSNFDPEYSAIFVEFGRMQLAYQTEAIFQNVSSFARKMTNSRGNVCPLHVHQWFGFVESSMFMGIIWATKWQSYGHHYLVYESNKSSWNGMVFDFDEDIYRQWTDQC